MNRFRAWLVLLAAALAVLAVACSDGVREIGTETSAATVTTGEVRSEVCQAGFEGFKTQFLPQVQDAVCSGCHNGDNPDAPAWLVGSDETIYLSVKNYVTFANIEASRLFIRAGNRHCGGSCNAAMAARMKGYLQAWYSAGESTCDQTSVLRSEPQRVPQNLSYGEYANVSWDLSNIDVNLRGVRLAMEIRRFTDAEGPTPGSYMFRKPRFVSTKTDPLSIEVQKLRILNNRNFQESANQFERVHAVVTPDVTTGSTMTYPVLSPEPSIVVEERPGLDDLIVTFEKLAVTTARGCRAMDKFTSKVLPVIESRACTTCHTAGPASDATATARFDMSGDAQALCSKFLSRTWTDANVLPALIQYPLYGRFEHPRVFLGGDKVLPDWTDWIETEWR